MRINFESKRIKSGLICAVILFCLYAIFLILPLFLSPVVKSYTKDINSMVSKNTGFDFKISDPALITTPMLGAGIKFKSLSISIPNSKTKLLYIKNGKADLRLLPLVIKKVQAGNIGAENVKINLEIAKNGDLEIEKYFTSDNSSQSSFSLPYGLKLSNNLPNIKVKNYKLTFIDSNGKTYFANGKNLKITDFNFNKKVKISTNGSVVLDKRLMSKYDIKIYNKIMPETSFDDLIFAPKTASQSANTKPSVSINVEDLFKSINKTGFKADLKADIKTSGTFKNPKQRGKFEINSFSVISNGHQLPDGYAKLKFRGKRTDIDSVFYTSTDTKEKTQILGNIKSGKRPSVDLSVYSNAKLNNIIRVLDSLAQSFGREDLKTVSAKGSIDANFKIKSNMKKVRSSGSLKILPSSINFGAYNVLVDKISADIDLNDNNINIKKSGFSILGHPLKLSGTISEKSVADLILTADKLPVKGLLASIGQIKLLNENNISSGTLSLKAVVKGKLTKIKPDISLNIDNINIYNKGANIRLLLNNALVKLVIDEKDFGGLIGINSLKLKNPTASVSVPKMNLKADKKDITINNSYVLINNSRVDVQGKVKDYLNDKLNINITAKGSLASRDVAAFIPTNMRSMFPYAGSMPLSVKASGNAKSQNIAFNLNATPHGYVRFLDIKALKNRTAKIHSDIKIENGTLTFRNSGLYAGANKIASLTGTISNFSNPDADLNISVPRNISFPIPGIGGISNITGNGNVNISGGLTDYKIKGKVNAKDISSKNLDFALINLSAHLDGRGITGSATADRIMMGMIVGTNLGAKFNLNNNFTTFNLSDISADAYDGKINGKLTYDIPHFAFGIDIKGKGLNSMNAIEASTGISKALTGDLSFGANLTGNGVTDTQIIKSLKGNIDFNIDDGRFVSIGKFENFVKAQNIESVSILKSAISALSTATAIQQTDKFKSIKGDIKMNGAEANLQNIKVEGPLMSYYVKGYYNLPSSYANLNILGRLDSKVVSLLGPFGQLTASKLLSYIPKFGANTAAMLDKLTQNPNTENIKLIPALTSGSKSYKDFKVVFIGSIYKASSIRSFRWLSTCDTTQMNVKQDVKQAVQAAKTNVNNQITAAKNTVKNVKTNVTNIVNTQKQKVENEKQSLEQTGQNIRNIKQNAGQSAINLGKLLRNAASKANQTMPQTQTSGTPAKDK